MNLNPPLIRTARLILRPAQEADIPHIIRYFSENREFLAPFSPRWPANYLTLGYWQEQLLKSNEEFKQDRALRLYLFDGQESNHVLGTIGFSNFGRGVAQFCHLGYGLAEVSQGQGYMTEALRAALPYVFHELRMHRVMANYLPHNQRSGKLLRRLGSVVEGYARDYLYINGCWQDHILTSLTNSNWRPY